MSKRHRWAVMCPPLRGKTGLISVTLIGDDYLISTHKTSAVAMNVAAGLRKKYEAYGCAAYVMRLNDFQRRAF